jgi:hypothetical protein
MLVAVHHRLMKKELEPEHYSSRKMKSDGRRLEEM